MSTRSTWTFRSTGPSRPTSSDALEELNLSYSGVFPNNQAAGDVLRLQCLRQATAWSHDVAVASPHGAALLDVRDRGHGSGGPNGGENVATTAVAEFGPTSIPLVAVP